MAEQNMFKAKTWEDSAQEKEIFGKDEFKTLDEGDNLIRLLGQYIFRNVHYVPEAKMKYILCMGDGCPLCAAGNMPKLHYYINILDRKDENIKILKFGITLKRKFQNLVQKYGEITEYDIVITRKGTKLDTTYEVLPMKESKVISEDLKKKMIDNFIDLETKFEIPTATRINDMMSGASSEPTGQNKVDKKEDKPAVKKECFGQKFNPINPDCIACELKENCKSMTIEFYTTGGKK